MKISNLYFEIIFFFILCVFSVFINYHYANLGVFPIDTFAYFDTGFNILKNKHPFKDTWVTVGPLLDYVQAGFFKLFGVNWFSYVLHASIFNILITITIFFGLQMLGLKSYYSFFYSLSVAILCYPLVGTPFADQHAIILSIISLMLFYASVKTKKLSYWFFLPIVMGLSFFCKQVPSSYINLIILISVFIYFSLNYNLQKLLYFLFGSLSFLLLIVSVFLYNNIPINNFLQQYILFPISLGEYRIGEYFNFTLRGVVGHFKFIYLFLLIITIITLKELLNNQNILNKDEFLIYISMIVASFTLVFHQLNIYNQTYIFFIIPILAGFCAILVQKCFYKKKIYHYLIIALVFAITLKYHNEYNVKRKFMDLQNVDLNKAISAQFLDARFNKLKWITRDFEDNLDEEILLLKDSISIIKNDPRTKMVITEYQFIGAFIDQYVHTLNRWYTHNNVSYPLRNHKYYEFYKIFFINKIKSNNIEVIYILEPIKLSNFNIYIDNNCTKEYQENLILTSHVIQECEDLIKF